MRSLKRSSLRFWSFRRRKLLVLVFAHTVNTCTWTRSVSSHRSESRGSLSIIHIHSRIHSLLIRSLRTSSTPHRLKVSLLMSEPKGIPPCLFKEQKNPQSSLCPSSMAGAVHTSCLLFLKIDIFARFPWRLIKTLNIVNVTTLVIILVIYYYTFL